jgi:hypothetical protein
MNSDIVQNDVEKAAEQAKSSVLKGIKKKLLRKNVMISIISVVCSIAIVFGGFSLIFHYQIPIPYENGLVSVKMGDNGMIDVLFNGDDYYCSYTQNTTIEKDGIKQNVAYIYYTDTIWTKYLSKPKKDKEYKYSINNTYWFNDGNGGQDIEIKKDIAAVYYMIYIDMKKVSSKEDLLKNSSNAILLWEK